MGACSCLLRTLRVAFWVSQCHEEKGISLHTNYMKGSCVQLQTTDTAVRLNDFLREVSVPALVQCTRALFRALFWGLLTDYTVLWSTLSRIRTCSWGNISVGTWLCCAVTTKREVSPWMKIHTDTRILTMCTFFIKMFVEIMPLATGDLINVSALF